MDAKDKEKRPCKNKKRWELIEHESHSYCGGQTSYTDIQDLFLPIFWGCERSAFQ